MPPYLSHSFDFDGGPHAHSDAVRDVHGGQMDGFIASLKPREGYCWTDPRPAAVPGQDSDRRGSPT